MATERKSDSVEPKKPFVRPFLVVENVFERIALLCARVASEPGCKLVPPRS